MFKDKFILKKIESEIDSFISNSSFGKGVAYFTTLNSSQRLINLSIVINLLKNDRDFEHLLKLKIEKIAYMEYLFVKKYNTSFYLIRNNHYICELISIIIYLKSTNIFFKTSHKKTYIDKLNEEVLIQINNYGETSEGSTSYDAFVLELLFLGNIFGVLNKTSKIRFKKLYLSVCNISSSKGSLPPFGDVTLE